MQNSKFKSNNLWLCRSPSQLQLAALALLIVKAKGSGQGYRGLDVNTMLFHRILPIFRFKFVFYCYISLNLIVYQLKCI